MSAPLRVLVVEDSEDDAALLLRELRRGGYDPSFERVETGQAMRAALGRQAWDLILSDHAMPRFSAPAALQVLKDSGLDIPFIIVSGAIGEETAVAGMKAGAHDYILKDRLARLTPAVERELREAEVRRDHKRLEKALVEASQKEQQRIGQDLHDGLGQNLTGISFLGKVLEQKLAAKSLPEAADAAQISKLVNLAISHTRFLARGLCPVNVERDGLVGALRDMASDVERLWGVRCVFNCPEPVLIQDQPVMVQLYHLAQEAVNNAMKHGHAHDVVIGLTMGNNRIVLSVKDNGAGLPEGFGKSKGLGLRLMDYRARTIGGELEIQSHPGRGTVVTCSLPYERARAQRGRSRGAS